MYQVGTQGTQNFGGLKQEPGENNHRERGTSSGTSHQNTRRTRTFLLTTLGSDFTKQDPDPAFKKRFKISFY